MYKGCIIHGNYLQILKCIHSQKIDYHQHIDSFSNYIIAVHRQIMKDLRLITYTVFQTCFKIYMGNASLAHQHNL